MARKKLVERPLKDISEDVGGPKGTKIMIYFRDARFPPVVLVASGEPLCFARALAGGPARLRTTMMNITPVCDMRG